MPTKRVRRGRHAAAHRITVEAIAAWRRADFLELHRALGLKPWEFSPLPLRVTALGVDQGPAPSWATDGMVSDASWQQAQELQRELLQVAGEAGRADEETA